MTSNTKNPTETNDALENQNYYYSRLQKDHFWFSSRQLFLDCLLKQNNIDLEGKIGLEIGCGNSLVSSLIEEKYNCKVDGIDLNSPSFRFPTKGAFFQTDITKNTPDLKEKYDFIVLFDIIEHIENVSEFLTKALEFSKPNGYIFVNVPAYNSFYSRYDEVAGHVRRYDSHLLKSHLLSGGSATDVVELTQIFWGFFYVPLVIARKFILKFASKKSDEEIYHLGFMPPGRMVNSLLKYFSYIEKYLFLGTGFGTSVMGIYQRKGLRNYES